MIRPKVALGEKLPNATVLRGPKVALIGMPFLTSHGTSHEFFIAVVFFMFLVFACGTQYVGLEVVFTAIDQIKVGNYLLFSIYLII